MKLQTTIDPEVWFDVSWYVCTKERLQDYKYVHEARALLLRLREVWVSAMPSTRPLVQRLRKCKELSHMPLNSLDLMDPCLPLYERASRNCLQHGSHNMSCSSILLYPLCCSYELSNLGSGQERPGGCNESSISGAAQRGWRRTARAVINLKHGATVLEPLIPRFSKAA